MKVAGRGSAMPPEPPERAKLARDSLSTYEWINLLFWGIHATATAGSRRSQAHVHPPGRSRELDVADRRCDRIEPGAAEIGPFRVPDHARAHRHRVRARVDGGLRCF